MGKGFNNYMCKKFFHPASRDNLKRVWMAEQKADSYKKKQEELRMQYEKEQDLYTNKAILSKESKDKLSVNFMYEPPPGTKKEREREDDEPEYKFEWQRKFNAPREDYCKGDSEIRDQPFGIQVRNVRCIKCHKWGHINTDKECPMYLQSITTEQASSSYDPMQLVQQMREDGLAMKRSAYTAQINSSFLSNQKLVESSEDEGDKIDKQSELDFLKSLSKEQKHRLLKKLEKLEKKRKKKKSDKKKVAKVEKNESRPTSNEDSEKESDKKHAKKIKINKMPKKTEMKKEHDYSPDRPKKSRDKIQWDTGSPDNSQRRRDMGKSDREARDKIQWENGSPDNFQRRRDGGKSDRETRDKMQWDTGSPDNSQRRRDGGISDRDARDKIQWDTGSPDNSQRRRDGGKSDRDARDKTIRFLSKPSHGSQRKHRKDYY